MNKYKQLFFPHALSWRTAHPRKTILAAMAAGLIAISSQPAAALERLLTPSEFEAIRHALQNDLHHSPFNPVKDAQNWPERLLGEKLYSDNNLSLNRNQSCATCHQLTPAIDPVTGQPYQAPGFVDADNAEKGTPVSDGSVAGAFGALNAPSAGYASFTPPFHWDAGQKLYVGGQFWNGRASTLAEQAGGPPLNPAEMAMPSKAAVIDRLKENAAYRALFWAAYRLNIAGLLSAAETDVAYNAMGKAIAAFERTRSFGPFTSKYDYFMAGRTELTPQERLGLDLFNNKAQCASCHVSAPKKNRDGSWTPALFTDYTYDNIGAPRNLDIPGNPKPNKGLGGHPDIAAVDPQGLEIGKHKTMSLRNIAITPPYGHNGVFKSLEQITHFYNTRDTLGRVPDNRDPGFGITGWPLPEVPQNVNTATIGNLGLTAQEEAAIVAFLKTLTDGYPIWGRDQRVSANDPGPYER